MQSTNKIKQIKYTRFGKVKYCYSLNMEIFYETYTDCNDEINPIEMPNDKLKIAITEFLKKES